MTVVLDHVCNGHLDVLLPLACEYEILQRAIGVVAAQHMALDNPSYQSFADEGRAALIEIPDPIITIRVRVYYIVQLEQF